jgi:hypothetical protein
MPLARSIIFARLQRLFEVVYLLFEFACLLVACEGDLNRGGQVCLR